MTEFDYWNEASELETGAWMPENASPHRGETDGLDGDVSAVIMDMVPLITTLTVVGMVMHMLSQMRFGGGSR